MATRPAVFKWRQTEPVLILCAVRWHLRYLLWLRDVKELLDERGLQADHDRAIESAGATIDFLFSASRDADVAKRLFRKALSDQSHPQPRVINTDL
jgi:transposase-like protein